MKKLILLTYFFSSLALAENARIATWNLGGFYEIPNYKIKNIVKGIENA